MLQFMEASILDHIRRVRRDYTVNVAAKMSEKTKREVSTAQVHMAISRLVEKGYLAASNEKHYLDNPRGRKGVILYVATREGTLELSDTLRLWNTLSLVK